MTKNYSFICWYIITRYIKMFKQIIILYTFNIYAFADLPVTRNRSVKIDKNTQLENIGHEENAYP